LLKVSITKSYPGFSLTTELSTSQNATLLSGQSGSGKTTLLRCIAGLEKPDHGYISFNDSFFFREGSLNIPPAKRKATLMSQENSLFPHLTVSQNILYSIKKKSQTPDLYHSVIKKLGLDTLEHKHPACLSGGEARRVMLARSLLHRPALLLLDEPFTGLDLKLCRQVSSLLNEYRETYQTEIIIATHIRQDLLNWIDNRLCLIPPKRALAG
jgi:ABC-type Fe3+/spermidine/putrescine transport system ATPase subunit